jgi:hypothetical protein
VFTSFDPSMKVGLELQDFWNLETIGIRDEIEATNDEVAMKKFRDTLTFQKDRYQVTWPRHEEEFDLPVNRQFTMDRLKSAVSCLSDKSELMDKYNKVLDGQPNQGIIEKVDYKQQDGASLHFTVPFMNRLNQTEPASFQVLSFWAFFGNSYFLYFIATSAFFVPYGGCGKSTRTFIQRCYIYDP